LAFTGNNAIIDIVYFKRKIIGKWCKNKEEDVSGYEIRKA